MIAVLVVTHGALAEELLRAAELILGAQGNASAVGMPPSEGPEPLRARLAAARAALDTKEGLLVLTDMAGGTPSNLSVALWGHDERTRILAGASLPMLLEIFLRRDQQDLAALGARAVEAGRRSAVDVTATVLGS